MKTQNQKERISFSFGDKKNNVSGLIMASKLLSKYEKISTILSVLALIIAIASPFVSYYWFDPQLQAFQNRARLQIAVIEQTPMRQPVQGDSQDKISETRKALQVYFARPWKLGIQNVGKLPAKDVQILLGYNPLFNPIPDNPGVEFDPPADITTEKRDDKLIILLKRPIAPSDTITMSVLERPDEVWVYNEFGEMSSIRNEVDPEKLFRATSEIWTKPMQTPTPKKPTR